MIRYKYLAAATLVLILMAAQMSAFGNGRVTAKRLAWVGTPQFN
jgi:hypothetical protein